MQNKKIILMGHADGLGGSQTAFWQLYDFIQQEGHAVRVVAISDNNGELPIRAGELLGQIAHHKSAIPLAAKKMLDVAQVGIKARMFQPDIFISVGLNNSANLISRFFGKKCFTIGQDFIADRQLDDPLWQSSRAAMDGIALQAPAMLTHWYQPDAKLAGVNWLPCFPEPPAEGVMSAGRTPTSVGKVRLAYFGRLAGNKGLPLVLSALAQPEILPEVTFDIWGRGAEEANLRQLTAELNLGKRVNFLGGYPSHEEGANLMASYDALVLCSTACEGLPLILLEAMAYGLPFLTTDIGAIRDCCVGNADAVLVDPNQEAINAGLLVLIKKFTSNEFSPQRHQEFYNKTFSYEVMAARWKECLRNPAAFFSDVE